MQVVKRRSVEFRLRQSYESVLGIQHYCSRQHQAGDLPHTRSGLQLPWELPLGAGAANVCPQEHVKLPRKLGGGLPAPSSEQRISLVAAEFLREVASAVNELASLRSRPPRVNPGKTFLYDSLASKARLYKCSEWRFHAAPGGGQFHGHAWQYCTYTSFQQRNPRALQMRYALLSCKITKRTF